MPQKICNINHSYIFVYFYPMYKVQCTLYTVQVYQGKYKYVKKLYLVPAKF